MKPRAILPLREMNRTGETMLLQWLRKAALRGALATAMGLMLPSVAAAQNHADAPPAAESRAVSVSLADLDLSDPRDRARAERRLRRAAATVCGRYDGWDRWGGRVMRQVRACERAATETALARAGLDSQFADLQWDENRRYQPIQLATTETDQATP
jgi:UrcA family protein